MSVIVDPSEFEKNDWGRSSRAARGSGLARSRLLFRPQKLVFGKKNHLFAGFVTELGSKAGRRRSLFPPEPLSAAGVSHRAPLRPTEPPWGPWGEIGPNMDPKLVHWTRTSPHGPEGHVDSFAAILSQNRATPT